MSILAIVLLGFVLVMLVLQILKVPIDQRAFNIVVLIILLLIIVGNAGLGGIGFK